MRSVLMATVLAVVLGWSSNAKAYTAESGFWWNPAESGSGLSIEIQDNVLFLAGYVYNAQGAATWVTSAGAMQSATSYTGVLTTFSGGNAIGASYRPNTRGPDAGNVTIQFNANDETAATLTWGGRSMPLKRFVYGLGGSEQQLMLGEWHLTFDLANRSGYSDFPYFGDVNVFKQVVRRNGVDYFEGCRPKNSLAANCTSEDYSKHDASGFYNATTDEHVIIVKDIGGSIGSDAVYFAYFLDVGTDQFDGVLEIFTERQTPGDGPYYPVRGHRTASKNFVVNGTGPSEAAKSASLGDRSISRDFLAGRALPEGLNADEVKAKFDIDVAANRDAVRQLAADMIARDRAAR